MRTNALLVFAVAGAMALTSCSKKIDEKTLAEINQFGTDWAALGEKATAWSSELTTTTQEAHQLATRTHTMMEGMTTSKDEAMKGKATEMTNVADQEAANLDAMNNEWASFKTSWDENTTAFNEWTNKVTKGEVSPEDATKGLTDWKTKLEEAQTKIDSWTTALAMSKENNTKNTAMCTEIEQSTMMMKK